MTDVSRLVGGTLASSKSLLDIGIKYSYCISFFFAPSSLLFCLTVSSLMPRPRAPPSEKRSGEQSQISWAYYPKQVMTNEIARLAIIT